MKTLTKEKASYLAGFIDADGSLIGQIVKQKDYVLKYQVRITLTLVQKTSRKEFLMKWQKLIGGTIRDRNDGISELNLVGRDSIMPILKQILPYIMIKTMQAKLILQIAEQLPLTKNSPERFLDLCILTDRISQLNDSKKRLITSDVVRREFLILGFIKE
jgi:hypothetical protein